MMAAFAAKIETMVLVAAYEVLTNASFYQTQFRSAFARKD